MKLLFSVTLLFSILAVSAQRKPGNEAEFSIDDVFTNKKIILQLNDHWFIQSKNQHFRTEDKVIVTFSGAQPELQTFDEVSKAIANRQPVYLGPQKWEQVGNHKIFKGIELLNKGSNEMAMIDYAIFIGERKVIRFMVMMQQRQLDEWEAYIDYVATTVTLQP